MAATTGGTASLLDELMRLKDKERQLSDLVNKLEEIKNRLKVEELELKAQSRREIAERAGMYDSANTCNAAANMDSDDSMFASTSAQPTESFDSLLTRPSVSHMSGYGTLLPSSQTYSGSQSCTISNGSSLFANSTPGPSDLTF